VHPLRSVPGAVPADALAVEAPDGRRVGPEVVRRFKLNLLGQRAGMSATSSPAH
jgi:hypothetical protein